MISRAKIRGKKLDEDCKRCCTSSHEYGLDDDRVFCYGLVDYSTDEIIENAKTVKHMFSMQHHRRKENESQGID